MIVKDGTIVASILMIILSKEGVLQFHSLLIFFFLKKNNIIQIFFFKEGGVDPSNDYLKKNLFAVNLEVKQ